MNNRFKNRLVIELKITWGMKLLADDSCQTV